MISPLDNTAGIDTQHMEAPAGTVQDGILFDMPAGATDIGFWMKKNILKTQDDFIESERFKILEGSGGGANDVGAGGGEGGGDVNSVLHSAESAVTSWQGNSETAEYGGQMAAGLALILLAVITAAGNSLVIHAIRTEKRLQTVSSMHNSTFSS